MILQRNESLSCRQLVELVTDYLDDVLPSAVRVSFEAHIAGCTNCSTYVAQFRETIELTGTLRENGVPPEAVGTLQVRFVEWKRGRA